MIRAISFALDRFAERLHDIARRMRGEPEPEGPHVCPGCYAVAEACASWCPDDGMRREAEEREMGGEEDSGIPDNWDEMATTTGDDIPF